MMLAAIGTVDVIIVLVVVVVLFGHRLPGTMRSIGRSAIEFKKGLQGVDDGVLPTSSSPRSENEKQ